MIGFFPVAFKFTLGREVGHSDDAADPGGDTQDGVTQRFLDDARQYLQGLPLRVEDLTQADQARMFQALIWDKIGGDQVPNWAALAMFDAAVNTRPETAVRWMQEALIGQFPRIVVDGRMGPTTADLLGHCAVSDTLREFHALRGEQFMLDVSRAPAEMKFAHGWMRRLMLAHDTAKIYLTGSQP